MLNYKKFLSILFFFCLSHTFSFANGKIASVDLDFVVNNSKIGVNILKKLEAINKSNLKTLEKKQKELQDDKEEINKVKNVISKDELSIKINEHNKKLNDFNKLKKELAKKINDTKKKEMKKLIEKINPLLLDYMEENSIDLLLRKESVYLSKNNYDITKEVLKTIDKKLK
jgi:Skp family chaperone for outer membrane proteins